MTAEPGLRTGSIYSLIAAVMVVAAAHALRLPLWVTGVVASLLLWRVWLAWQDARLPSRWVLILLAIVLSTGVISSYMPFLGRDASVALLAVMTGLKCLELRTLRDATVVICLGYFLIVTNFLYSQTISTALVMLAVLVWLTATMVSFQSRDQRVPAARALRTAGALVAQAAPLMVVLFVLFPRIEGPVFGFPQATSAGVSGLSDTMSPGDLANLGLSDEVAFRVRFDTPPRKPANLYWRGPVLWDFDGRSWSMGSPLQPTAAGVQPDSEPLRYQVTLEPHHMRWLFAVDLAGLAPPGAWLTADYQLLARRPVHLRLRYEMASHLTYRFGMDESPTLLRRALRLPSGFNPRTVELARKLRTQSATDIELVSNTLNLFRNQLFFYTLVPPLLGRHSVDEFLFDTRRGFCEHYASAFVFIMRAAGVPARVVTGYLGGEINPLGDYLIVRQSEAHAWAEVWLQGRGWIRVDPTAAVSPARIEVGVAAAVPQGEPLPNSVRGDFALLKRLRFAVDAVTNSWNQWVLGYTPERQSRLLKDVGIGAPTWQTLTILVMGVAGMVLLALAFFVLQRLRRPQPDPAQHAYHAFIRKLASIGLLREAGEGPLDFAHRVCDRKPKLAPQVRAITELYLRLRYGSGQTREVNQLVRLIRAFRP